jgi:hypothetical protein
MRATAVLFAFGVTSASAVFMLFLLFGGFKLPLIYRLCSFPIMLAFPVITLSDIAVEPCDIHAMPFIFQLFQLPAMSRLIFFLFLN